MFIIGLFCPFAHRANLVRHIKGLQSAIDVSIVRPYPKGDSKGWPGWRFPANEQEYEGATVDKLFGSEYLHEVYLKDDKDYKGRYSVPLLWDKKTNRIVNNVLQHPSSMIVRIEILTSQRKVLRF
jgi:glutathionyl-hydroquinone reductase